MSLYFFHLCDGHEVVIDPEGREIALPEEVSGYALREARAIISQDALAGKIVLEQRIEVRDEAGTLVHKLAFRDAVTIS